MDRPAAAAPVLGSMDPNDPHRGGDPIQHIGGRHADLMKRPAAIRAGAVLDLQRDLVARHVLGEAETSPLAFSDCGSFRRRTGLPGFSSSNVGVEILEAKIELVRIA